MASRRAVSSASRTRSRSASGGAVRQSCRRCDHVAFENRKERERHDAAGHEAHGHDESADSRCDRRIAALQGQPERAGEGPVGEALKLVAHPMTWSVGQARPAAFLGAWAAVCQVRGQDKKALDQADQQHRDDDHWKEPEDFPHHTGYEKQRRKRGNCRENGEADRQNHLACAFDRRAKGL